MTTEKTPPEKKPLTVSVTKIKTFQRCNLKFYREYVLGEVTPKGASLQFGTLLHDLAEKYLKGERTPADLASIAANGATDDKRAATLVRLGIPYLPPPAHEDVRVEEWIRTPCGPLPLVGKVDAFAWDAPRGVWHPGGDALLVLDHKTSADFKWALSGSELARDPQMLGYAHALGTLADRKPSTVALAHVVYRTRGAPIVQRTDVSVGWSTVENGWKSLVNASDQIKTLANIQDPDMVLSDPKRANPAACGDFGGCPFKATCKFSPDARDNTAKTNNTRALVAPRTETMNDARTAARNKLFGPKGGAPAATPTAGKPAARVEVQPDGHKAVVKVAPAHAVNPPDALVQGHKTDAPVQAATAAPVKAPARVFTPAMADAARALQATVDAAGSVALAHLAKILNRYGVPTDAADDVIAYAECVTYPDGTIGLPEGDAAEAMSVAAPAPAPVAAPAPAPEVPRAVIGAPTVGGAAPDHTGALDTLVALVANGPRSITDPSLREAVRAAGGWTKLHTSRVRALAVEAAAVRRVEFDGATGIISPVRAGLPGSTPPSTVTETPTGHEVVLEVPPETPAQAAAVEASNVKSDKAERRHSIADMEDAREAKRARVPDGQGSRSETVREVAHAVSAVANLATIILVDCHPEAHGVARDLAVEVLHALEDHTEKRDNKGHVYAYPFRDGPKAVAAALLASLRGKGLPPGVFTLRGDHPAAPEVIEVLRRVGAIIVRGVR